MLQLTITLKRLLELCDVKENIPVMNEKRGEVSRKTETLKPNKVELTQIKNTISEFLKVY